MLKYVLHKLFNGTLILLGVVIVVFFIFNVLPGDPVNMMAGQRTDVSTREAIAEELGLNEPLHKQLCFYLNDLSPISIHEDSEKNRLKYEYTPLLSLKEHALVIKTPYLRRSFQTNKRISELIYENIEGTFILAFSAILFATLFGIGFGILSALNKDSWIDNALITTSVFGVSIPPFVLGAVMSLLFGFYLSEYTGLNATGYIWEFDIDGERLILKNLLLPALTLGMAPMAIIMQLTRSSLLEVLTQDYIRTAHAKGLPHAYIIFKHALKNALNPVITAVSGWLASLMAGAFFIEYIFSWKGLGTVTINAVETLDFPVVMGTTLFVATIFVVTNIFVDILYGIVDPRVRIN
jgi:ABC-type dipeptide/oligopeptide/nickel transport system permease component